jgi:hypothetical protein
LAKAKEQFETLEKLGLISLKSPKLEDEGVKHLLTLLAPYLEQFKTKQKWPI